MADSRGSADARDERAAERDDAAHLRDVDSDGRDAAADRRDAAAAARDVFSAELGTDFEVRFRLLRRDLLGRFDRNSESAIDSDDFPDLTPAALARLRAYADGQRRTAAADRAAALAAFAEIHNQLRHLRADGRAAAEERRAASDDRHTSASDRRAAAQDRDGSLQDRSQAAIEREQTGFPDPSPTYDLEAAYDERVDRVEATVAQTRQKVRDSRELLTRPGYDTGRTVTASDGARPSPDD